MNWDLTRGPVMKTMLRFAIPMILGDLLQQCYNIADTLIVGRFLGTNALAAVGSAFSLMTFLTSIILGLAMGSGTVFSIRFGQKDRVGLKENILASFALLGAVTVVLNIAVFAGTDLILRFLRIEGVFYCLIGGLFLLYGLYRGLGKPGMSVVLTVVSLGTRVGLAYALSAIPTLGVVGIWWSVPIGWFLADALGVGYYFAGRKKRLSGAHGDLPA